MPGLQDQQKLVSHTGHSHLGELANTCVGGVAKCQVPKCTLHPPRHVGLKERPSTSGMPEVSDKTARREAFLHFYPAQVAAPVGIPRAFSSPAQDDRVPDMVVSACPCCREGRARHDEGDPKVVEAFAGKHPGLRVQVPNLASEREKRTGTNGGDHWPEDREGRPQASPG